MCSQLSDTGAALPKVDVAMLKLGEWYFGVVLSHKNICFFLVIIKEVVESTSLYPAYRGKLQCSLRNPLTLTLHLLLIPSLHLITMCHHGLPFLLGRNSRQLWELILPWLSDQLPGMQH